MNAMQLKNPEHESSMKVVIEIGNVINLEQDREVYNWMVMVSGENGL